MLDPAKHSPVMCLTQDGLPLSHEEQAQRLCAAGARWIQLRAKGLSSATWLELAIRVVAVCRRYDAICIINDSVDIALAAEADGVHLGRLDEDWRSARGRLGPQRILGGTINCGADARHALALACLDYAGVGPWRFTDNKQNLAAVLGPDGVRTIVAQLEGLPAWAIGGIQSADLPAVRDTGAAGAAVSSDLFRGGRVEENYRVLTAAWNVAPSPHFSHSNCSIRTITSTITNHEHDFFGCGLEPR